MFNGDRRLKKKIERLQNENGVLRKQNSELKSQIDFYDKRLEIINEKEYRYNVMLEEVYKLRDEYNKRIAKLKKTYKALITDINKVK